MKIAAVLIVKPTDEEAALLEKCLESVSPYMDGLFVTITGKNLQCEVTAKYHGATVSHFEWIDDFAAARNFSFSQVPKDFDYIFWCDADDIVRGFKTLRSEMTNRPADVYSMFYLYSFDKYKNPDVVHTKTRVVRNDGCVKWVGRIHEEFTETRALKMEFLKDQQIIHTSTDEKFKESGERNLVISKKAYEESPEDITAHFNYAKSLQGTGKLKEAVEEFEKFLKRGVGDGERYLVQQSLGRIKADLGDVQGGLDAIRAAIGLLPAYPDAYYAAADVCREAGIYEKAAEYYMLGLTKKPQYLSVIVYNPREYDYRPLVNLAQCFVSMSRPDMALICFRQAAQIQPEDVNLRRIVDVMDGEAKKFEKIIKEVVRLEKMYDKKKLKKRLDSLPSEIRAHPSICVVHNRNFIREKTDGKTIDYFCGLTAETWTPETARTKGIGGSEEAVIQLTKRWAAQGYTVTVYNACGTKEQVFDGVTYKPWWMFNGRDKRDVLVVWRHPSLLDHEINADKVLVDLHDVVPAGEFTPKRLERIDKILVKTKAHRDLFPAIPDSKFVLLQNGIEWAKFQNGPVRDPYLLVNTSSPDRSLSALIECFEEVKKEVPQAKLAWAYGWKVWDAVCAADAERASWKKDIEAKAKEAGVEVLGRLGHEEILSLYQRAAVFAYPTAFFEISCISLMKAMAAGAIPVTSDFAALGETSGPWGVKVPSGVTTEDWSPPGRFDFAIRDEESKKKWVKETVRILKEGVNEKNREDMRKWAKRYDWDVIASNWVSLFKEKP